VQRFDQRQGFLVSALVHLVVLMTLASHPKLGERQAPEQSPPPDAGPRVFLPPQAELRRLFPKPTPVPPMARPVPTPAPVATPPPPSAKDRISVGAPTDAQTKKPLVLRRDESLLGVAKGTPNAVPNAPPPAPASASQRAAQDPDPGKAREKKSTPGVRLPTGVGEMPSGTEGSQQASSGRAPSISASLMNLEKHLQESGARGIASGTTQRLGALSFDPQGADFTAWLDHWRIEVYNNWLIPKPAELGYHGHVDFEFTVERDGSVSSIRMLSSSGTPAFDRAARNALMGSNFLRLPADYGPPRVTMGVTFSYNEGPAGS
jgi:TonB family protein